jgi:hypothetical protein
MPATKRCLKLPRRMWVEMDKVKKNQYARNIQGKRQGWRVELLIEHSQPEGRNGK